MIVNRGNFGLFRRHRVEPDRPVLRPERGPADWLIEVFALAGILFFAGYAIYNYSHLPASIPTHFNGSGKADDYGGKESFLILPGVALFIYILLTLISRVPHTFNFTVKITPANALRQYTLATRMIRVLKTVITWLFWYISYTTIQVARGVSEGLGGWFLPVILGFIFVPVIIYFLMARMKF